MEGTENVTAAKNVLVIGGGAREHALVVKLSQSPRVGQIFCVPGNAGIAEIATLLPQPDLVGTQLHAGLAKLAGERRIDLTVVGSEDLLVDGIVDVFQSLQLRVFGPTKSAARLEGSKMWAKSLMQQVGIPTAAAQAFLNKGEARALAESYDYRCVVKSDRVAKGKGSFVCDTVDDVDEALAILVGEKKYGDGHVLIEERLEGQEVSVFAISDGRTVIPFGAAQDHKRRYDSDLGPNTGGMGAYSPVEHMKVAEDFAREYFGPVVRQMAKEGTPFVGVLYAGAIVTSEGPKILEFNCRFGDPEAEVILTRLEDDLFDYLWAASSQTLHELGAPRWSDEEAVCVVLATESYPTPGDEAVEITGIDRASSVVGVQIFHAGTDKDEDSDRLFARDGRVFAVTATGSSVAEARRRAYKAAGEIQFEGKQFRSDIAEKADGETWQTEPRKPSKWEGQLLGLSDGLRNVYAQVLELELASDRPSDLEQVRRELDDMRRAISLSGISSSPQEAEALKRDTESEIVSERLQALHSEFEMLVGGSSGPEFMDGVDAMFSSTPTELQGLIARGRRNDGV